MRRIVFLLLMFCSVGIAYSTVGNDDVTDGLANGIFRKSKAMLKAEDKALENKLCGKPCPEFTLNDSEGKLWTHRSIRGKVTLINIWHVYCEPCINEFPQLNELMKKYPEANFLSMTFNTPEQVEKVKLKNKLMYHQLFEAINFISKTGITATPTCLLIDKSGTIRYVFRGADEKQCKRIVKKMKELSKEEL